MTILDDENIFARKSEALPGCAQHGETYLRTLVKYVKESQAPVTVDVEDIPLTSGFRPETETRVILAPTQKRLTYCKSLHFAKPIGSALTVGYDLVGKKRAGGFGTIALSSQKDMDNLGEIMTFLEQYVIVPAMQATVAVAEGR